MDWGGGRTTNWAHFVDRPAVGMWAEDVSRVTSYLLSRNDVESVSLLGYGLFGKVALYAAALDPRIKAVALTLDALSYMREATAGNPHACADVPHILTWGDTAQVAAWVAPRPLAILGAGFPDTRFAAVEGYFSTLARFSPPESLVAEEELAANLDWTNRFYHLLSAEDKLALGKRDVPAWFARNF